MVRLPTEGVADCYAVGVEAIRADFGLPLRIPIDVAQDSEMISPTIPI
ncbi:hypothetical protein [Bradyrhizobium guangdongense]|nr:hypothetical protein [Bradyrhizobium guangdongense]